MGKMEIIGAKRSGISQSWLQLMCVFFFLLIFLPCAVTVSQSFAAGSDAAGKFVLRKTELTIRDSAGNIQLASSLAGAITLYCWAPGECASITYQNGSFYKE
jgi:hypothetical protein